MVKSASMAANAKRVSVLVVVLNEAIKTPARPLKIRKINPFKPEKIMSCTSEL